VESEILYDLVEDNQKQVARVLKILGDPNRIRIIDLLREGELCQCEVIPYIGQSQPTVSRHLNILERNGVLLRRKEGTKTFYKIADEKVLSILDFAKSLI
jgi:ArsR family transcriptional regulator